MTKRLSVLFALLVVFSLALSACGPAATPTPAATEAPVVTEAPTEPPAPTPTEPPPPALGTAENPLIMALAPSATTQELQTGGEAIAAKLSEMTGLTIKTVVPTNYAAMIEAMGAEQAHIGWLAPVQYIVAHGKGYADVALATIRNGSNHYGFQYVANAEAGFTSYYDAATAANTADAATALAQFADKKPCWTDPLSSSGYILPFGLLTENGVKVKSGAWVQGHPTVIKSVYLSPKGEICDFGATFIDARSNVAADFPDVNDKVVIIWVSEPFIPNDNVSFSTGVPAELREKIAAALLELAGTEEGIALLKSGGYSIQGLEAVDDTFYDEFRVYLEASGIDPTTLFK
ncbi:MAG: phosphate/phosphite/phosphonate ABC transporter substrate-binding protein [Chloroflexi bacterium]|nr:phosphate/phosphite/phosphonate ABC transporter substrate-binding protein [Chloroflexota bacterium]